MNAIVESRGQLTALTEAELIKTLQSSLYPGASPESIKMVISYCTAANLDPMQKPVHIVPMWDSKAQATRDVVMPGVGLYRTQAARSGCAGISEPEFGEDVTENIGGVSITYPKWCRVTVRRRIATGEIVDFTARELWTENYAVKGGKEKSIAPNAMWAKRPYGQIAKCAEAQALRKAFPEVGSAPTADEMEGKTINDAGTYVPSDPTPTQRTALPAYPDDSFQKNLAAWRDLIASGRKTAEQIIAMVSSKAQMTPEQLEVLRASDTPATVDAE